MKKLVVLGTVLMMFGAGCAVKNEAVSQQDDEKVVQVDYSKYDFSKPGFYTKVIDNRLWVFKEGDKNLEAFLKDGELAKHITMISAGPHGVTIKAPDKETIEAYMAK
ncbi:MAG: hypothetical protein K6348_06640 [Deferribacterales bacterium]